MKHTVWVITRANNESVHGEEYKKRTKPARLHFVYYDTPAWLRFFKKGKRFFLLYYYIWQVGSYFRAKELMRREKIDIAHHLTGGMDWMPSGLSLLPLPFVWGSVGSEDTHPQILKTLPLTVKIKEYARNLFRFCGRNIDPFTKMTMKRARVILSHSINSVPRAYHSKTIKSVQTGIRMDEEYTGKRTDYRRGEPFTVIYAGELIHWKGAQFAAEAYALFAPGKSRVRMIVIGVGPLRETMMRTFDAKGTSDTVQFEGRVTLKTLMETFRGGDIFLYPSYHHGLATVVLQAMISGLPVVCLEGDAISDAVGKGGGLVVSLRNDVPVAEQIAEAMNRLYDDEPLRSSLAKRAHDVAETEYSYTVLVEQYLSAYERIAGRGNSYSRQRDE